MLKMTYIVIQANFTLGCKMKTYAPGDSVKFKSQHGSILDGTVYDSSTEAVMITTHFGTYSVHPDSIISGGTWKITVNHKKKEDDVSYDIGWWDQFNDDDGDTF